VILIVKTSRKSEIQKIIDDDSDTTKGERYLAALTAGDRIPWAQARKKYFSKGVNRNSLYAIEKVYFLLKILSNTKLCYIIYFSYQGRICTCFRRGGI
jgi:hypothetical protein